MTALLTDSFGSTTTSPAGALAGINDFCEGFVSYQPRSANVLQAADDYPDSALANIYAGILYMFLERPEAPDKSIPYSERARKLAGLNTREQGLLAMLEAWQQHNYPQVRAIADELTSSFPQDLPLLKIAQYHAFNAADAEHMLHLATKGLKINAHHAPVHSMLAFAHEQLNNLDCAERAAHDALHLYADEPWAHHALAHIHLGRGTVDEGLKILSDSAPSWQGLNSFMFTHNWWHVALFDIARGDVTTALKIYDDRCWGVEPEYSQDQIGAVSLLARLEMAGADVGDRWQRLQPYLQSRHDDVIQPFLTLQYLYGLARCGAMQADSLLTLIRAQGEAPQVVSDATLWQEVGIPLAEAIVSYVAGDYDAAVTYLAPIRGQVYRIGGSHAQRDVFEQLLLDARLRAGHWAAARKTLVRRQQWEPDNPQINQRLLEIQRHIPA